MKVPALLLCLLVRMGAALPVGGGIKRVASSTSGLFDPLEFYEPVAAPRRATERRLQMDDDGLRYDIPPGINSYASLPTDDSWAQRHPDDATLLAQMDDDGLRYDIPPGINSYASLPTDDSWASRGGALTASSAPTEVSSTSSILYFAPAFAAGVAVPLAAFGLMRRRRMQRSKRSRAQPPLRVWIGTKGRIAVRGRRKVSEPPSRLAAAAAAADSPPPPAAIPTAFGIYLNSTPSTAEVLGLESL